LTACRAAPKTDADKALVGGYWLQICRGNADFPSQDVNNLLKDQGHAIGNVTRAFDNLRECRPTLVHQLEKGGKTKQARKKLKLTQEGIKRVKSMLSGNIDG
jgi:hypothetical protein